MSANKRCEYPECGCDQARAAACPANRSRCEHPQCNYPSCRCELPMKPDRKPFADWLREKISVHRWMFTAEDQRHAGAVLAALDSNDRDARQARVVEFVKTRFGERNMDRRERAARVLEEALEIAQVEGMTIADVAKLGNHVYSKPAGEPAQEAAGTGVALLAYAAAVGVSADAVEAAEVDRIYSLPTEHFRARHQAKADAGVALPTEPQP